MVVVTSLTVNRSGHHAAYQTHIRVHLAPRPGGFSRWLLPSPFSLAACGGEERVPNAAENKISVEEVPDYYPDGLHRPHR